LGSGNISLIDSDSGSTVQIFNPQNHNFSYGNSNIYLNLSAPLKTDTQYDILIPASLLQSSGELSFNGLENPGDFTFHTNTISHQLSQSQYDFFVSMDSLQKVFTPIKDGQIYPVHQFQIESKINDILNHFYFYSGPDMEGLVESVELWQIGTSPQLIASTTWGQTENIDSYSIRFENLNVPIQTGTQTFELRASFSSTSDLNISQFNLDPYQMTLQSGQNLQYYSNVASQIFFVSTPLSTNQLHLLKNSILESLPSIGTDHQPTFTFNNNFNYSTTGNITLHNDSNGDVVQVFSYNNGGLGVNQNKLTLYKNSNFEENTPYSLRFNSFVITAPDGSPLSAPLQDLSFTSSNFEQATLDLEEDIILTSSPNADSSEISIEQGASTNLINFRIENKGLNTITLDQVSLYIESGSPWALFSNIELWRLDDPHNPTLITSGSPLSILQENGSSFAFPNLNTPLNSGHNDFQWRVSLNTNQPYGRYYIYMPAVSVTGASTYVANQPYRHFISIPNSVLNNGVVDIVKFSPSHQSSGVSINDPQLRITFDQNGLFYSSGNLEIRRSLDDSLQQVIEPDAGEAYFSQNMLYITPSSPLELNTTYYITTGSHLGINSQESEGTAEILKGDWVFTTQKSENEDNPIHFYYHNNTNLFISDTTTQPKSFLKFYLYNYHNQNYILDGFSADVLSGDLNWIESISLVYYGNDPSGLGVLLETATASSGHFQNNRIVFSNLNKTLIASNHEYFGLDIKLTAQTPISSLLGLSINQNSFDIPDHRIEERVIQPYAYLFSGDHPLGPISPSSFYPNPNNLASPQYLNISFNFNEELKAGSGTLSLRNDLDEIVATYHPYHSSVQINNQYFYIDFPNPEPDTRYSINMDEGFVVTESGRPVIGVSDNQSFWFETGMVPDQVESETDSVYLQNLSQGLPAVISQSSASAPVMKLRLYRSNTPETLSGITLTAYEEFSYLFESIELWDVTDSPVLISTATLSSGNFNGQSCTINDIDIPLVYGHKTFEVRAVIQPEQINRNIHLQIENYNFIFQNNSQLIGDYSIYQDFYVTDQIIDPNVINTLSTQPLPQSTNIPTDQYIYITFDRKVSIDPTGVTLFNTDNQTTIYTYGLNDIYSYNNQLEFSLPGDIAASQNLELRIAPNAVTTNDGSVFSGFSEPFIFETSPFNEVVTNASTDLVLDQPEGGEQVYHRYLSAGISNTAMTFRIMNKNPSLNDSLNSITFQVLPHALDTIAEAELWNTSSGTLLGSLQSGDPLVDFSTITFDINEPISQGYTSYELRIIPKANLPSLDGSVRLEYRDIKTQFNHEFSGQYSIQQQISFTPYTSETQIDTMAHQQLDPQHLQDNIYSESYLHIYFDREISPSYQGNISIYNHSSGELVHFAEANSEQIYYGSSYYYLQPPQNGYPIDTMLSVAVSSNLVTDSVGNGSSAPIPLGRWLFSTGSFQTSTQNPNLVVETGIETISSDNTYSISDETKLLTFTLQANTPTLLKDITFQTPLNQPYSIFESILLYRINGTDLELIAANSNFYDYQISFNNIGLQLTTSDHDFVLKGITRSSIGGDQFALYLSPFDVITIDGYATGIEISNNLTFDRGYNFLRTSHFAIGQHHTVFEQYNGTYGQGYHNFGQLTPYPSGSYQNVLMFNASWTLLDSGESHIIGIDPNGSVWAWGGNEFQQTSNDSSTIVETPFLVFDSEAAILAGASA
jgi:hypothetical protein